MLNKVETFERSIRSNILSNSFFFYRMLHQSFALGERRRRPLLSCCWCLEFPQRESSQEDGDAGVLEDDISLSISELPPELHCSEALAADLVHDAAGGELDSMDGCVPRLAARPPATRLPASRDSPLPP